jgi:hypothetical protein
VRGFLRCYMFVPHSGQECVLDEHDRFQLLEYLKNINSDFFW